MKEKKVIVCPPFFKLTRLAIENLGYGGTERICLYLILGLIDLGYDVVVFACKGSHFDGAQVIETFDPVERIKDLNEYYLKSSAQLGLALAWVKDHEEEIEVVHNHCEGWCARTPDLSVPFIFTHHNGWTGYGQFYAPLFPSITHVAISESEKAFMQEGGMRGVERVYNGVNTSYLRQQTQGMRKQGYAALLGRFSPEKGFDIGIRAAIEAGVPVKIAAKIPAGGADLEFFRNSITPLLNHPLVEYVGAVNEREKALFLGQANLLLLPNPAYRAEPFGLVIIEALASGAPVVGSSRGAATELVGTAGLVFDPPQDSEEYIHTLTRKIETMLDTPVASAVCRQQAQVFSLEAMVDGYVDVYQRAIQA